VGLEERNNIDSNRRKEKGNSKTLGKANHNFTKVNIRCWIYLNSSPSIHQMAKIAEQTGALDRE